MGWQRAQPQDPGFLLGQSAEEEKMPRGIGGRSSQAFFFFFLFKARNCLLGEEERELAGGSKEQQDFTDLWEHCGPRLPGCHEAALQTWSWFPRLKELHTPL